MTKKRPNWDLVGRGIERIWHPAWLHYDDGDDEYEICPVCGAEKSEWEDCWQIGCDDGWITDLYEQDPLWYDEDDVEMCSECQGKGGWWVCSNLSQHPEFQTSAQGGDE